jgi:hypothetical protein
MKQVIRQSMMIAFLAGSPALVSAEALQRVSPSDAELDCTGLAAQEQAMAEFIAAGDPNAPSIGKAAAGGVANAGGQVAGAAVAQGAGLFGGLGGLVGKVAGAVAQQQVQESMAPDAAAQQRAAEAKERKGFLGKLAIAKECRPDEPAFPGKRSLPTNSESSPKDRPPEPCNRLRWPQCKRWRLSRLSSSNAAGSWKEN